MNFRDTHFPGTPYHFSSSFKLNTQPFIELEQGGAEQDRHTPIELKHDQLVAVRRIRGVSISELEMQEFLEIYSQCKQLVGIRSFRLNGGSLYIYNEIIDTTLHLMLAVRIPFDALQIAAICSQVTYQSHESKVACNNSGLSL
jgi:hypothetical protein